MVRGRYPRIASPLYLKNFFWEPEPQVGADFFDTLAFEDPQGFIGEVVVKQTGWFVAAWLVGMVHNEHFAALGGSGSGDAESCDALLVSAEAEEGCFLRDETINLRSNLFLVCKPELFHAGVCLKGCSWSQVPLLF